MWVKNPRKNDANVSRVVDSIKRFGFGAPIVARRANGEVIAGHTRLKAAIRLKLARVPVRYLDITEHEAHLLALADNRLNELSPWDVDGLQEVMTDFSLSDIELAGWSPADLAELGGELLDGEGLSEAEEEGSYTREIKAPIYEPKGPPPPVSALCDRSKVSELLGRIDGAGLPHEVSEFLRFAAERHARFDFRSIANFYAHAPAETKRLMEDSALVIIDFDRAIENGFIKLSHRLGELVDMEKHSGVEDEDPDA